MTRSTLLCLPVFLCLCLQLTAQDVPNPPAKLQTLPAGSYVIPMDNTLQQNTSGKFNLKAYGLVVHLLNNNISLKWVMRAGKAKDAVDFTANAEQVKPVVVAGGVATSFKSAPFVIFAADTFGVSSLINGYYASQGLTGNDRPRLYRTTTATASVDIRYDMTGFVPKAAILTDGGNQKIHREYMIAAGVTLNNYREVSALTLGDCFTFASEPHNDQNGPVMDAMVFTVRNFVLSGRNFLAECAAVRTYENNLFGRFHSAAGLADANEKLKTDISFAHPDLSFYQIDGAFNASVGGSLQNWTLPGAVTNPSAYAKATGTGTFSSVQAASVTKLVSGPGGMVFYLGNHEFKSTTTEEINGIRMYLNAFLTPTQHATVCGVVLGVQLSGFQGSLQNNNVQLQWKVEQNEQVERFEVEKSTDGVRFETAGIVSGSGRAGSVPYPFTASAKEARVYYRVKLIEKTGAVQYSAIILLQTGTVNGPVVKLLGNPVRERLQFSYQNDNNETELLVRITDIAGRSLWQQSVRSNHGNSTYSLPLPSGISDGIYLAEFISGNQHQALRFVRQ